MQNSVLPANLSLIRSNGCVASVDMTPPLSPATRCSYLTPEKKESGTVLVGVSLTSAAIAVNIIFGELGVKCSPANFGHARNLPAKQLIIFGAIYF